MAPHNMGHTKTVDMRTSIKAQKAHQQDLALIAQTHVQVLIDAIGVAIRQNEVIPSVMTNNRANKLTLARNRAAEHLDAALRQLSYAKDELVRGRRDNK